MARIGVNVPSDGSSELELLQELGVTRIRIVARRAYDLRDYLRRLGSEGIKTILVLARESLEDFPTWEEALAYYADLYGDAPNILIQVGNEWDHRSDSSWTLDYGALNYLLWQAREAFGPRAYLILGGAASGQPEDLRGVDLRFVNAIAIHPYGQGTPEYEGPYRLGNVDHLLDRYQAVLNAMGFGHLHKHVTEYGANARDVGEDVQAEYVSQLTRYFQATDKVGDAILFCLCDHCMVPEFGLQRGDETRRRAFTVVQAHCRGWW